MNTLESTLSRTPQGRIILASLKAHKSGLLMGKGHKNIFQNIGKYTHKFTGQLAKVAAGMIGIPPSAIDALAKADPTAHGKLLENLANTAEAKEVIDISQQAEIEKKKKTVMLVAGAGIVAVALLIFTKK